jgi:pyruvate/2-oxoglutarate dehydrogenase complex dihydrolipoamide acyltransferase (E2) component
MAKMSVRRKLAIATWSAPREGNIYGKLTVDVTEALEYLEALRERTGEKVTLTHLVGAAVGRALAQAPGLNGKILWGRYYPHKTVDVAYLVALDGGNNLGKVKVEDVDHKTPAGIAAELRERAIRLRDGKDEAFKKSMGPVKFMPTWLLRPVLWFTGWLASSLGVRVKALGVERYPFGSAIITSVGMFGLDEGWAPPTPFARVPVYVLIGALRDQPAVVDGTIEVRKRLTLCATIDHRFLDGFQGGVLAKVVKQLLEDPWAFDRDADASDDGDD